jgi:hypothetical protein
LALTIVRNQAVILRGRVQRFFDIGLVERTGGDPAP